MRKSLEIVNRIESNRYHREISFKFLVDENFFIYFLYYIYMEFMLFQYHIIVHIIYESPATIKNKIVDGNYDINND